MGSPSNFKFQALSLKPPQTLNPKPTVLLRRYLNEPYFALNRQIQLGHGGNTAKVGRGRSGGNPYYTHQAQRKRNLDLGFDLDLTKQREGKFRRIVDEDSQREGKGQVHREANAP